MPENSSNVLVVKPHLKTRWAHVSIVDAFLFALEVLYERYAPAWFYLLSAACYPVKNPQEVVAELFGSPFDVYLNAGKVSELSDAVGLINGCPAKEWLESVYYRRYAVGAPDSPYSQDYPCYAGSQWLTANAKAARILISSRRENNDLFYHYVKSPTPDESYCHTVLCNRHELRVCDDNKRYVDWSLVEDHPKELFTEDLGKILKSGCHFARKMNALKSSALMDSLDVFNS